MKRNRLDEQLESLGTGLIEMGAMVEEAIELATKALLEQDGELSNEVYSNDYQIDKKEKELEALSMKLLILQQPVASDLRKVSVALKMIADMERIGDHAAEISDLNRFLVPKDALVEIEYIQKMSRAVIEMLNKSIDAFVKQDRDLAKKVIQSDDNVDGLYNDIRKELIQSIHKNPDIGEQAFDLLQVAKYYERIGDHATNIANWVIYSVTGRYAKKKPQFVSKNGNL